MKIKTAVWKDIKDEDLSDLRAQVNSDCTNKYYEMLQELGLNPNLHEPTISFTETPTHTIIRVGVKPIKRIGGVPINQVKFTD